MVQSPDVESPDPNPLPSMPTDESRPHTQRGWHLIEFPWFQWAHTQDLQVPVFAFDKQMTPMELRSQPAKTRVGERKIKSHTDTRPISTHMGLSPMMFTLCVLSPRCLPKIHPPHTHDTPALVCLWFICLFVTVLFLSLAKWDACVNNPFLQQIRAKCRAGSAQVTAWFLLPCLEILEQIPSYLRMVGEVVISATLRCFLFLSFPLLKFRKSRGKTWCLL